jgi:hypothetical protein
MQNKTTKFVALNGKHYTVTIRDAFTDAGGYTYPAETSIWVEWEVPSVADRWSVRPTMIHKSTSVSPYGRLGKKILAALSKAEA